MKKSNDVVVTREGASPSLWEWLDAPDFARWFDMRPFFGRFDWRASSRCASSKS